MLLGLGACSSGLVSSGASDGGPDAGRPLDGGRRPPDGAPADASRPPDARGPADGPGRDAPRPPDAATHDGPPAGPTFAYVGSDDGAVHVYRFDPGTGALADQGSAGSGNYPSFLAFAPTGRALYAVNEAAGELVSFAVDAATGALTRLGQATDAGGPAHVTVDPGGGWVLSAQYGAGSVRVFPVGAGGRAGDAVQTVMPGANAHQVRIRGAFAYVPCKGADHIAQYRFDAATGRLADHGTASTRDGAGPRHLDFHPARALAYVMNENDSTIDAWAVEGDGTLRWIGTQSTLPAGFGGASTGADVHVHPSGRFVYGSNRGHDSIAIFAIDDATGALTPVGHEPTTGRTPRNFTLDPTGRWLVVANQEGRSIVTFAIDPDRGTLALRETLATPGRPFFVGLVAP